MPDTESIRILLVGGYAVVRAGVRAFLAAHADLWVVGEAADAGDGLRQCAAAPPDIVLLDAPAPDAAALARELQAAGLRTRVVALADNGGAAEAEAGSVACVRKSAGAAELADSIRRARHAGMTMQEVAAQAPRSSPVQALTPREREVLSLMAEGLHNNEIAVRLVISPATVKFHVSSILAKLGATTRTEAVAIAVEQHLASAPHPARPTQ